VLFDEPGPRARARIRLCTVLGLVLLGGLLALAMWQFGRNGQLAGNRWAPFAQTVGPNNEPMYWLTISSKRDFGVRLTNTGLSQPVKRAQIWMTPFFPMRAATQDPSARAFRLPFQNLESSNQTAQWTERVVPVLQ